MKTFLARLKPVLAVVLLLLIGSMTSFATAPDASGIVTTASTTFDTVGALIASVVGFFIIVKIIKWIRK